MRRIILINSKGGCGKTTIASNLACYYAAAGMETALMDYDPQGSSRRWLELRSPEYPPIHGVFAAGPTVPGTTKAFQNRLPPGIERAVVDTPASIKRMEIIDLIRGASGILVPMLPSAIDRYVTGNFLTELRSLANTYAYGTPIGIIANRVRPNTLAMRRLHELLGEWGLPLVASLRDTQHYLYSAELGIGVHELKLARAQEDVRQWAPLIEWVEGAEDERHRRSASLAAQSVAHTKALATAIP